MGFEIEIIKFLQRFSAPITDNFFYAITQLGTEIFLILAVMVVYWCVNKREGFRLINVFMASQMAVGTIKVLVRRPRPYTLDGVRSIFEATNGFSFPSGHSNNIAVIGTDIAAMTRGKKSRIIASVTAGLLILLVMLSRMYLGQHYLSDVLTGALIGVGVGLVGYMLFDLLADNEHKLVYAVAPLCAIILVAAVALYVLKGEDSDSLIKIAGIYSASSIGYYLEKRFVGYEVRSEQKYKYVLRVLLGAAVTVAFHYGLKALFGLFAVGVWNILLTEFVRYFIDGIFVTYLAPLIFKKLKI